MFNNQRLKKLRVDLKLSQTQMAHKLNMEQSTYSRYETNKADLNLTLLQKIKDEFGGVEPSEFITNNNSTVTFENGSTNNGNGIVQFQNYYAFPKEMLESMLKNQEHIVTLIKDVIKQHKV
jgi:transcriptional regulator with XRE-family HTH domain